ncbi:hypothetical protein C3747_104g52 [Trypanosoma cruzi]|uniref:Uncharacterized protein n=2 Tax=Trypanosoma cruzi TaxID=5693 RepID=Q4DHF3_TRYCC|nr:hypothetical protein, conserved [Trypanosoma cruzi]EAN91942.1 hypothetical protein, conserved [Trypanosoma cruzi]PWV07229.1 hypothetical protein C3747_104g52 [Trypanosoma cruzi]|eukprot:XP_813793.1 hypothetical protein [Trypanosoma cruzi strain CL Brener]
MHSAAFSPYFVFLSCCCFCFLGNKQKSELFWPFMFFRVLVAAVFVWLTGTAGVVDAAVDCGTAVACYPWANGNPRVGNQKPCVSGGRMNLRFILDVAAETSAAKGAASTAVYGFCPVVDKLEAFKLHSAHSLATLYSAGNVYNFSKNVGRKYLSVYGFGMSNSTLFPEKGLSAGAVVIAENGDFLCGSDRSVALVHALILDIGLHRGRFNYIGARGASSPGNIVGNGTTTPIEVSTEDPVQEGEVSVQPAMVGFRPTCTPDDVCVFDSASVCIGDQIGNKNCAKCYTSPKEVAKQNIVVWASYDGTDAKGRPLLSGGMNPLIYNQFAGNMLKNDFDSLIRRMKS